MVIVVRTQKTMWRSGNEVIGSHKPTIRFTFYVRGWAWKRIDR